MVVGRWYIGVRVVGFFIKLLLIIIIIHRSCCVCVAVYNAGTWYVARVVRGSVYLPTTNYT